MKTIHVNDVYTAIKDMEPKDDCGGVDYKLGYTQAIMDVLIAVAKIPDVFVAR